MIWMVWEFESRILKTCDGSALENFYHEAIPNLPWNATEIKKITKHSGNLGCLKKKDIFSERKTSLKNSVKVQVCSRKRIK